MPKYQVSIIERPEGWVPASPEDVPVNPGKPLEVLNEADELFVAVREAVEYNDRARQTDAARWAVVVEPGTLGKTWRNARLCTPLSYKVVAIWWPGGWEPKSPLDVPNCIWKGQGETAEQQLTYQQAVAAVRGLNQQAMNHAGMMWYVIVAVENEPVSQTVSYEASGTETTVEVRRLHVIRPEEGGGRGDCSYCPARSFRCATEDWIALEQTETITQQRVKPPSPDRVR